MKALSVFFGGLVLSAGLLVTTHTYAGNTTTFKSFFINKSNTTLEVIISLADGTTVDTGSTVNPSKTYTFKMYFGCDAKRTRTFTITEKQNGAQIGSGKFTMTSGRDSHNKNECLNEIYDFDAFSDDNANDGFIVTKSYKTSSVDGRNRNGKITISSKF